MKCMAPNLHYSWWWWSGAKILEWRQARQKLSTIWKYEYLLPVIIPIITTSECDCLYRVSDQTSEVVMVFPPVTVSGEGMGRGRWPCVITESSLRDWQVSCWPRLSHFTPCCDRLNHSLSPHFSSLRGSRMILTLESSVIIICTLSEYNSCALES